MKSCPNRYYLVAIPEGEIMTEGLSLQRELAERFRIYREPYPPLHLTVGVFSCPPESLTMLLPILSAAVTPFLPLKMQTGGEICFPSPYRSINLLVNRTPILDQLSALLFRVLTQEGFVAQSFAVWDYHISLVNSAYGVRELSENEYQEACSILRQKQLCFEGFALRFELWDPHFPPLKVMATFER